MKTRIFNDSDFEQSIKLRKYVFRSAYTAEKDADYKFLLKIADNVGIFDEHSNLMGQVLNLPLFYNFYGCKVPVTGVNHVGVLPEYRGQGIASKLVKASIEQSYKRGQLLSILQPFSVEFYRKFGYDLFTERIHYRINTDYFPTFFDKSMCRIIRRLSSDLEKTTVEQIYKLYDRIACSMNGMQLRDNNWWQRINLQFPNLTYALLFDNNQLVAYLSYRIIDTKFEIIDFIFDNSINKKVLWNFVSSHRSNVFEINGTTTTAEMISYEFNDPRINQQLWLDTMIRIIDLPKIIVLWLRKFPAEENFCFYVSDPLASWNTGYYQISGQHLEFRSGQSFSGSSTISIGEISAILFGPLTKDQLYSHFDVQARPFLKFLIDLAKNKKISNFLGEF